MLIVDPFSCIVEVFVYVEVKRFSTDTRLNTALYFRLDHQSFFAAGRAIPTTSLVMSDGQLPKEFTNDQRIAARFHGASKPHDTVHEE